MWIAVRDRARSARLSMARRRPASRNCAALACPCVPLPVSRSDASPPSAACWPPWACLVLRHWYQRNRWCATSSPARVEMQHIDTETLGCIVRPGHRATGATRPKAPAGGRSRRHRRSFGGWVRAKARQRAEGVRGRFPASVPVAHYSTLGMLISEFWPVTAASVAPASLPVPAKLRASSTASPGPDRRKPTARPSASSRPACANGPTPEAMPTAPNALPAYLPSWSITTVGDLIQPSATNLQLPATAGTTYCYLTNS